MSSAILQLLMVGVLSVGSVDVKSNSTTTPVLFTGHCSYFSFEKNPVSGLVAEAADRSSARPISYPSRPASTALRKACAIRLGSDAVSYTHLRAHETPEHLVCRLLLEKKKK